MAKKELKKLMFWLFRNYSAYPKEIPIQYGNSIVLQFDTDDNLNNDGEGFRIEWKCDNYFLRHSILLQIFKTTSTKFQTAQPEGPDVEHNVELLNDFIDKRDFNGFMPVRSIINIEYRIYHVIPPIRRTNALYILRGKLSGLLRNALSTNIVE
ncbi:unnamed protein product [Dracunculus medinensis]|uniref:Uncharacterized protein n=1 Tax=Dracunculus medinensis TaxID=318479 RepID=A0A0N4UQK2_DRAME|nr:unnamed protein product [Dracunculus medinensis]